jgi:transcriptional regulator GlxA family with amidase domain
LSVAVGEIDALLEVAHPTSQPLVSLSYSVPVKIDALNFSRLFLSLRSLQAGFRQWRNATPNAYLRQVRLRLVREELLRSDKESNVTTVALQHGFMHLGRFSAQYRAAFGEGRARPCDAAAPRSPVSACLPA